MSGPVPADWLDRVSESLREHEERQNAIQSAPPRYEILGEIGRGGMGIVYRAWDPQLGRNVALKVLRTEEGRTAEVHERFQREAKLAACLQHPHIVQIFDSGTWNGQDYIAMQLIEGTTLDQAKPDRRQALICIRDAARALHHAHQQGIIHRDVKPGNLLVDSGGIVYVTDFGVARQTVVSPAITSPGTVVGTPNYMSPEQAQGLPTDARSDVYSLGASLYELVVGRPPVGGRDAMEVIEQVRSGDPEPPRRAAPDLSKNVEAMLLGAMERSPAERYRSAAELADEIDRYLRGERPLRRPRGWSYRVRREFVRHPWRSTAAIIFCALLLMAGIVLGFVVRSALYWRKAGQTTDSKLRIGYLRIAAKVFPGADDELTSLLALPRPAPILVTGPNKPEREPTAEPAPTVATPRPPAEIERSEAVAKLVLRVQQGIRSGQLNVARQVLDEVQKLAPERVPELKSLLEKAEMAAGIRELADRALKTEDQDFDGRYADLKRKAEKERKEQFEALAPQIFQRALAFGRAKKWTEALKWFDEAERLNFQERSLYEQRGLALLELKEWDRAEKDLQSLNGLSGTRSEVPPRFAMLAYRREHQALLEKNWTEALAQAKAALHIDPNHASAHHDRGIARFGKTGRARDALEDLRTALRLESKLIPSEQYRDIFLRYSRMQGEIFWKVEGVNERDAAWQEALVFLNLALDKHFAGDVDLLLERATIRRRLGDIPAALGDARQALSASADSRTNLMMGILIFLQGRIPKPDDARTREALEFLEKAVELSPGDYRPLFWRGVCLRDLGGSELERAFEDLRTAYRLHSASPFLALQLAGTRVDLMFRDSSSKNWKDAVDEAANAILGADSLSDEDLVAGFYELRRLSRSQAIKLHSKEAHLSRAKAFNQGREFDRSVEECSAAIEIDSGYRLGYLWRGYAYCSSRNHKEAQSDFRSAIKLSNDEERKAAEKWLNRCLSHSRN